MLVGAFGCGPTTAECNRDTLATDSSNCGACGIRCGDGESCTAGVCTAAPTADCTPGESASCYGGPAGTLGVGICQGGTRTCQADGTWSSCAGAITPGIDVCGNGADENCNGTADEDTDADGDGYTTCAGDCCDGAECAQPELVNPGAFETAGNNVDDDCDGTIDNALATCDSGLVSNSTDANDFARAIDLCRFTTEAANDWGVISAALTLPDGTGTPAAMAHAIRDGYGTNMPPLLGERLALLSSGSAADVNDTNPGFVAYTANQGKTSGFPADWFAANGGQMPNIASCPPANVNAARDPVMLTLRIRTPSNAKSFRFSTGFYSYEYPEYTCSPFNDFFVVLLDSAYNGTPANPADKNLAFYAGQNGVNYPVGVNLAYGDTGLFTVCNNGTAGCFSNGTTFQHTACTSNSMLVGTGLDAAQPFACDMNALAGGGTGWLVTSGNVVGGEIITLRIAIWDTSDGNLDSFAVLDRFEWSVDAAEPGTVIE